MARKTQMMPTVGGSGIGGRIATVVIVLVVLTLVIKNPTGSAHTVVALAHWVSNVIDALSTFGQALSGRS